MPDHLQEEEEADYQQRFPDYHTAFDDILDAEGMEQDDPSAQSKMPQDGLHQPQATQAQASSAVSKQLMQGQLLDDIVAQHARCACLRLHSHRLACPQLDSNVRLQRRVSA